MFQNCVGGPALAEIPAERPGKRLRRIRAQRGITARQVQELSREIAADQGNGEFLISHGRITQIENNESTPSIYKLCSLSAILSVPLMELITMFVDLESFESYAYRLRRHQTHLVNFEVDQPGKSVSFPVQFDPAFDPDSTNLLSRMVQVWGDVPPAVLNRLRLRSLRYGVIGLNDYTLHPLLKPGSFVQIDDSQRRVVSPPFPNEYDRPIYFIELREGYVCGWAEMQGNKLVVLPHPLSNCRVRVLDYPVEAEVVGRVVAVAARIAELREAEARQGATERR